MMEYPFIYLPLLLLPPIFLFYKFYKLQNTNLPPGPPRLPFIGNLHQLIHPLPHRALASLAQKYGSIMRLQLGEQSYVVISSAEMASAVLKTNEKSFAQRPQVVAMEIMSYNPPGLFCAPYGDYWKKMRKVCVMELFNNKMVQSFGSIREKEAVALVETVCENQGRLMNVSRVLSLMASNVTSRAAFGLKCNQQEKFLCLLDQALDVLAGFNLVDMFPSLRFLRYITGYQPKLQKLHRKISDILDEIIQMHNDERTSCTDKEEKKQQDIIDVLIELQKSNHHGDLLLTNNHLKGVILDIFSAGTETSSTTMDWAMAELVRNPEEMFKAQTEIREAMKGRERLKEGDIEKFTYLKVIVKETLRLHPPGALIPREAMERCNISGYEIPLKTKIIINQWAMGRDERNWAEPDAFKPERFLNSSIDFKGTNYEFLPFGAGRRMCPGISFAIAKIEITLAHLLFHFDWKLPHGSEPHQLDMTEAFGLTVRKKHNLELVPTIRIPFNRKGN